MSNLGSVFVLRSLPVVNPLRQRGHDRGRAILWIYQRSYTGAVHPEPEDRASIWTPKPSPFSRESANISHG